MRGRKPKIQAKRVEIEGVYFILSENADAFGIEDSSLSNDPLMSSSSSSLPSSSSSSAPANDLTSTTPETTTTISSSPSLSNEGASISPPPLKKDRMTLFFGGAPSIAAPAITTTISNISITPGPRDAMANRLLSTQKPRAYANRATPSKDASRGMTPEQRVRQEVHKVVTARLKVFYDLGKFADVESMDHLAKHLVSIVANKRVAAKKFELSEDGRKRIEEFVDKSMKPNNDESFVYDYRMYMKKKQTNQQEEQIKQLSKPQIEQQADQQQEEQVEHPQQEEQLKPQEEQEEPQTEQQIEQEESQTEQQVEQPQKEEQIEQPQQEEQKSQVEQVEPPRSEQQVEQPQSEQQIEQPQQEEQKSQVEQPQQEEQKPQEEPQIN